MDFDSGKNFAKVAKLVTMALGLLETLQLPQLTYKKGGGGKPFILIPLSPPPPPPLEPPLLCPASTPTAARVPVPCPHSRALRHNRVPRALSPIAARAYGNHAQPSTTVRAARLSLHCPSLRRRFSSYLVPPFKSSA